MKWHYRLFGGIVSDDQLSPRYLEGNTEKDLKMCKRERNIWSFSHFPLDSFSCRRLRSTNVFADIHWLQRGFRIIVVFAVKESPIHVNNKASVRVASSSHLPLRFLLWATQLRCTNVPRDNVLLTSPNSPTAERGQSVRCPLLTEYQKNDGLLKDLSELSNGITINILDSANELIWCEYQPVFTYMDTQEIAGNPVCAHRRSRNVSL